MIPIDERDATFIRILRVDVGCPFARIGAIWKERFGITAGSGSTNAESGETLCKWAANLLNDESSAWAF